MAERRARSVENQSFLPGGGVAMQDSRRPSGSTPRGSPPNPLRIWQAMAMIAVFAVLLALPRLESPAEIAVSSCLLVAVALFLAGSVLVEVVFGIQCPGCRRWALRRLVASRRHFRCTACGIKLKRSWSGPWLDASGPDDAAIFSGKSRAHRWLGYAVPQEGTDTTTGKLLGSQRRRGSGRGPEQTPAPDTGGSSRPAQGFDTAS
jgi:hypothetical protein